MDPTLPFRRSLTRRIVEAALLTLPVAPLAAQGCHSSVLAGAGGNPGEGGRAGHGGNRGKGGNGGTGGVVSSTPSVGAQGSCYPASACSMQECFAWPVTDDAGCEGLTTGAGGAGGTGGSGGGGMAPCPAPADASAYFSNLGNTHACGVQGVLTDVPVTRVGDTCCYSVSIGCCSGRPFLVDDRPRTAPVASVAPEGGTGWRDEHARTPDTSRLTPAIRERLAAAWTRDALLEHASVASFGRLALELLAVGAPAHLLEDAHRAALDEVRHARLCLGLASAYAGTPIAPAPFPFDGRVEVDACLATVAARAVREGCLGETLASLQAAEQLACAEDPAVRAVLEAIAEDEARHAAAAWRLVAWAVRSGGAEVRAAVASAFAEATAAGLALDGSDEPGLRAHGRLPAAELRGKLARGLSEIVRPCAEALLAVA